MEIFTIDINNEPVNITRNGRYAVTFIPTESVSGQSLQKTGIVTGMSINLHFLKLNVDGVEFEIPVDEITEIAEA